MRPARLGLLLLLTAGASAPARAQMRPPEWNIAPVYELPRAFNTAESSDSPPMPGPSKPTYWREGGVIGAVLLGILGGVLLDRICGDNSASEHCGTETVGGAVIGAGVGFAVGALIGGQFPKGP